MTADNPLAALIAEKGVLLADGATGTNLFAMGLESGDAPELWNMDAPEKITALHQGFVDAGSDIILTNSFGGTRHRLKLHHAQDRVFELNKAAAELACEVAASAPRRVLVAGSVGPTGELLEPLGALTFDGAVEAFREQINGLKAGGAEVIWIETMSAPEEMRAAAEAAIAEEMPYTCTVSFDTAGKSMMGLHPKNVAHVFDDVSDKPAAVGANCGVGASDILSSLLDMRAGAPDATIIVKGNCGIPEFQGENIVYSGTPDLMADYVRLAIDAGAQVIGGCCGTSFEHLKAMRAALDSHKKAEPPTLEEIAERIGPLVNSPAADGNAAPKRERRGRRRA
ncbi:MAG: betaine--homocysteine S-methyltransferase [Phyllobacteriaceae bacterium]|jgi:5-methyltetrahydrofolate--homocysteine methyltransferase|nr:betaine--homocysteine S-methyltransferase [Phyllobacteriaceae bacterium]